jgi:hypothetical protein
MSSIFVPEPDEEYEVDLVDPEHMHTGSGFCYDMTCPCHEDGECIHTLGQAVEDGLASPADADRIYRGRTV